MRPEEELRYLILGAQREGNRVLAEQLSPLGLTPSQAEVIRCLSGAGPISLKALGELLVCETGSPSRLVDTLVNRAIVARHDNPADRRQVTLALTAEGQRLDLAIVAIETALYHWIGQLLDGNAIAATVAQLRLLTDGSTSGQAIVRRKATPGKDRASN